LHPDNIEDTDTKFSTTTNDHLLTENEIIERCNQQDRTAQKILYERYAPKLLGVCRRYLSNKEDAEDVLADGLFKIMNNIHQYQAVGSFEGWMRRIVVNEALMFLRKRTTFIVDIDSELNTIDQGIPTTIEHELAAQEIIKLLEKLPIGYRTVFNLFVIEGYKHIEIAELLGISINTSKSQLILAKEKIRKLMSNNYKP
jgi:RNA polymerase sigma factor (sigma-70 family)